MPNLVLSFFVCVVLFAGAGNVHSQSRLPPCTSNNDRDNCFGEAQISGGHFVGEFKGGKPNGQGTLMTAMGARTLKFIGEFRDGQPAEGRFIVRESNGVEYNFASKDGKPDFGGEVIATHPNGSKLLTGNAKNDNAVLTWTWPDGSKFVGQLIVPDERGQITGRGTLTYADGATYVGEIKNDKLQGKGVLTLPNGRTYTGEFKDDLLQGTGMLMEPNGTSYVGDFKDGKVEGHGALTWRDGRKYVGDFKNEKAAGRGTITWPGGLSYSGEFADDRGNGTGTVTWPDGRKYVGQVKDDAMDGRGIEYRADGSVLRVGLWQQNLFVRADPVQAAEVAQAPPPRVRPTEPVPPTKSSEPSLSSTGTAFFVSTRGHLLTNGHVVEGCKRLVARRSTGESFATDVVAVDEQNDLALLRSNVDGIPATFRRGPAPLGETITVFGFPLTGTLAVSGNLTTGSISALAGLRNNPGKYQVSAPIQPGNSGGAVLDESGLVVGVVQSSLDAARSLKITGDIPQNINFAIKNLSVNKIQLPSMRDVRAWRGDDKVESMGSHR